MPPSADNAATVPQFSVKIGGSVAPERVSNDLLEILVESSINMPDMATMKLHDAEFHWIDDALFAEGKAVEISSVEQGSAEQVLFKGEIVGIEMDLSAHGSPSILVRCFDKSHRMHRGRKARAFQNVKDSDLASQLGAESGLTVVADATTTVHDWVLQNNQTNWEFLMERAALNGFRMYCRDGNKLYFEKADKATSATVATVSWGETLRSFRPRMSTQGQVDKVQVRGWDQVQKQVIVGESTRPRIVPEIGGASPGRNNGTSAYGAATMIIVDQPIESVAEATTYAASVLDDIGGTFVEAEGLCYGNGAIKAGTRIEVTNIGRKFSGKYYVTSATHTYTPGEGFSTLFVVSGKRSHTLIGMVDREDYSRRKELGGNLVIGLVTDNKDPENLGRVKVKYPWLTDDHESYWCRVSSQMGGANRGFYNTPEINDEVLVAFEHGEVHRPIVIGMLWNKKDSIPEVSEAQNSNPTLGANREVNRRGIRSRIGHQINLDDTDGKGGIVVWTKSQHFLKLSDEQEEVVLKSSAGRVYGASDKSKKIWIHSQPSGHYFGIDDNNNTIHVVTKGGQKIDLTDSGNTITIQDIAGDKITMGNGTIEISAAASMTLKAPTISIDADVSLKINAGMTNMSTKGICTISASGIMNITGSLIKLN